MSNIYDDTYMQDTDVEMCNKAYQQGRADAIEEYIKIVDKYDSVIANYLREELKEQTE